jgi:hypothetical protein
VCNVAVCYAVGRAVPLAQVRAVKKSMDLALKIGQFPSRVVAGAMGDYDPGHASAAAAAHRNAGGEVMIVLREVQSAVASLSAEMREVRGEVSKQRAELHLIARSSGGGGGARLAC